MVAVATPGLDGLLDHFDAIGAYISSQEQEVFRNLDYIRGNRARTARYAKAINSELDHVFYHAHAWSDTAMELAYRSGWEGVYGTKSKYTIPAENLQEMAGRREAYRKRLNDMEKQARRDVGKFMNTTRKMNDDELIDREIRKTLPKITAGTTSRGRYKLADWAKLQTKAAHQAEFNHGLLDAAIQKGVAVIEVSDGPGCGWTSHNDPDTANGKLVSPEEAKANPIAHPNCQRSFIPRPDLKGKDKGDKRKKLTTKQKAIAITGTLAAAGIARALFQVTEEIVDPELAARYASITRIGRIYERGFLRLIEKFQKRGPGGELIELPFYQPPPEPIPIPMAAGAENTQRFAVARTVTGPPTLKGYQDSVLDWGEALLDKRITVPQLPPWFKEALHVGDKDSVNSVTDKLNLFARWVHGNKVRETSFEQGAKILNFQTKRRQWNDWIIFRNADKVQSAASFTWTKYGPRTRIDLTDFLRGRVTLTKDGIRRSITFNPAGNLRGMLGLSQDGTLLGAVRLVPNRLFRAIIETDEFGKITGNVRLVPKNLPFRVRLTFETPRPKNWQYTDLIPGKDFVDLRPTARALDLEHNDVFYHVTPTKNVKSILKSGLRPSEEMKPYFDFTITSDVRYAKDYLEVLRAAGEEKFSFIRITIPKKAAGDYIDLEKVLNLEHQNRGIQYRLLDSIPSKYLKIVDPETEESFWEMARKGGRTFGLDDFSMREVFWQLRQMQLKDIHFEVDLFRYSIARIHGELKIPVNEIVHSVQRLMAEGVLKRDGAGFTGLFRWVPTDAAKEELQNLIAASGQKILGSARFSQLNTGWLSSWLPNVNARAYFDNFKFREILTSVRISGLNTIKDAKNLTIFREILDLPDRAWGGFQKALTEVDGRIQLFLQDHGLASPRDIEPFLEQRYSLVTDKFGISSRPEIYRGTLEAIRGVAEDNIVRLRDDAGRIRRLQLGGQTHRDWLRLIADIGENDSRVTIERKLRDLVHFMRSTNLEDNTVIDTLDAIDNRTINLASYDIARENAAKAVSKAARARRLDRNVNKLEALNPELAKFVNPYVQPFINQLRVRLDIAVRMAKDIDDKEVRIEILNKLYNFHHRVNNYFTSGYIRKYGRDLGPMDGLIYKDLPGYKPLPPLEGKIKRLVDETKYPELAADIDRLKFVYQRTFPGMEEVSIKVGTFKDFFSEGRGLSVHAYFNPVSQEVVINPLFARSYTSKGLRDSIESLARIGHFQDTATPRGVLAHELAHALHLGAEYDPLEAREAVAWIGEIFREEDIPIVRLGMHIYPSDPSYTVFADDILNWARANVSQYAGTNVFETIAESMAMAMGSGRVSPVVAKIAKHFLEEYALELV